MPRLVLIRDIMAQRNREIVPMGIGYGVLEHVPPDFDLKHAQVIHNGKVRLEKDFLEQFVFTHEHEEIILRIVPGDFGTAAFIIGMIVVSALLSFGVQALMPAKKPENKKNYDNSEESPTYSWDGIQNTTQNGAPIPLVFGRHKVAGQFLGTYTLSSLASDIASESLDDVHDLLYVLVGLSAGPICAIDGVTEETDSLTGDDISNDCQIDNNPASVFEGVEVSYRMGEWTQAIIKGFHDIVIPYDENTPLAYGSAVTYTTTDRVNGVDLLFRFISGLYQHDADGAFLGYSVDILIEYQESGAAGWTTYDTVTFSGKTRSTYNRRIRIEGLDPAIYLFRVTRQTADDGTYTSSEVYLRAVNEIRYDDVSNKGVACKGVKAIATEQLYGRLPNFTSIVHGIECKVFQPGDSWTQDTCQDFALDQDKLLWGWYSYDGVTNRAKIDYAKAHTIQPNALLCKHAATTSDFRSGSQSAPMFYKEVYAAEGFDVRVYCDFLSTSNSGDGFGLFAGRSTNPYYHNMSVGIFDDSSTKKWWTRESVGPTLQSGTAAAGERYFRITFDGNNAWEMFTSTDGISWTSRETASIGLFSGYDTVAIGITYFSESSSSGDLVVKFENFDFADETCYSREVSNNPAWVAYYVLTNNHYGLGAHLSESNIDLDTFIDYAAFCNTMIADGYGSTHRKHVCDIILDARRPAWDQALRLLEQYRATLVKQGDQVRVAWLRERTSSQVFAMTNIKKGTFVTTYQTPKIGANLWEIQFINNETWEQDYAIYVDPAIESGESYRRQTGSAYGITRAAEAYRLALFRCKFNRYATQTVQFETGVEGVTIEPYDVMDVQHALPAWGESGRVVSAGGSTVTLDKPVTIEELKQYQIKIRHADDTIETQTVVTSPQTTTIITVPSWTSTPAEDDIWVFGEINILTKQFIVTDITTTGNLECRITGVEYHASLFDDTVTRVPTVRYTRLADPRQVPGNVSGLVVVERPQRMKDGTIQIGVDVTWSKASDAFSYSIYYREQGISEWSCAGSTTGTHFVIIGVLKEETTYEVAVVAVGQFGAGRSPDAAAAQTIYVQGKIDPPGNVTNLRLSRIGETLMIKWDPVADADILYYQVRYGETNDWQAASGNVLAKRQFTTEYTTSDFPEATTYYFLVKAYNNSGIPSATAASIQESVIGKPSDNVVVSRDENALGWPGTKTNMTVVSGDLELDSGYTTGSYEAGEMDAGASVLAEVRHEMVAVLVENTYTWATATFTWGSATGLNTTWIANPEGVQVEPVLKFRYGDTSPLTGSYAIFQKGWYRARYFQFKVEVTVDSTAYSVTLGELLTFVDPPDIFESGTNESISASGTTYISLSDFATAPDVTVTPYNGAGGDVAQVVSVTSSQFGVKYYNSSGTQTSGYINWIARGY